MMSEAVVASPDDLVRLCTELHSARQRLIHRPVDSILKSLHAVVEKWLSSDSEWRSEAERALPSATGFSAEMIARALPLMIEPLRGTAIAELLDRELGSRRRLDSIWERRRAVSPGLVLHVLSGNLAGLAAIPVALTLSIKSAALVKAAAGDRVFPELFRRSITAEDSDLGACVAVRYWPGGDRSCEDAVIAVADLVVASGSDASIADMRARCGSRFIGHGHKVSVAVVGREILSDSRSSELAAKGLALDVSLWDQRGCLSPQVCFVEGTFAAGIALAERLAPFLEEILRELPPGRQSLEERAAVARFRNQIEWAKLAGREVALLTSRFPEGWTIAVESEPVFRPTPLCRSLRILPITTLAQIAQPLVPAGPFLEAAGVAVSDRRLAEVAELLLRAGAHWVCPIGRMQCPPLSWPQSGRPRVADWVSWGARDDGTIG
jgi:hypothetical protein